MSYYEKLNDYIRAISCTSKELAEHTGLSISLISKYRNGSRTPKADSQNFYHVITGLKELALIKGIPFDSDKTYHELACELNPYQLDYEICLHNFNKIIDLMGINLSNLAKYMQMDVSFLYRVRSGNRKPYDITQFFETFVNYLLMNYGGDKSSMFHDLILSESGNNNNNNNNSEGPSIVDIMEYLNQNHDNSASFMDEFFEKLDSFDIRQYTIQFDQRSEQELTEYFTGMVPRFRNRYYTGAEQGKKAELDFLKSVLASDSKESLFLYNEVSMESEFTDPEFYKKWLFGLALLLKNGIEINIIHNIYRPAKEMLMGIRSWLPLYMSGAVHSYYFDVKYHSNIKYMHCTSGHQALVGETMEGNEQYLYYYTTKQPELSYYQEKSKYLMEHAKPLMDFYFEGRDSQKFQLFLDKEHAYSFPWIEKQEFKNIEFRIKDNEWVMISRITEPKLHFVIYNQQMIHTIRTYLQYY